MLQQRPPICSVTRYHHGTSVPTPTLLPYNYSTWYADLPTPALTPPELASAVRRGLTVPIYTMLRAAGATHAQSLRFASRSPHAAWSYAEARAGGATHRQARALLRLPSHRTLGRDYATARTRGLSHRRATRSTHAYRVYLRRLHTPPPKLFSSR
jgi:hypothetical protein